MAGMRLPHQCSLDFGFQGTPEVPLRCAGIMEQSLSGFISFSFHLHVLIPFGWDLLVVLLLSLVFLAFLCTQEIRNDEL